MQNNLPSIYEGPQKGKQLRLLWEIRQQPATLHAETFQFAKTFYTMLLL